MNSASDVIRKMVETALFVQPRKTEADLREFIRNIASLHIYADAGIDNEEVEKIAREIEVKQGIKVGLGAIVDGEDFIPWLDDAKPSIDPFYWERYQKLLLMTDLPKDVVIATDKVTDKILSRLGDPNKHVPWDRRGMVVGHVQSGKTANYTGLICKAADAGYRLIIVIAGIHNNLRNQTQARIDEGFIGRDTGKSLSKKTGSSRHIIGVGKIEPGKTPVSLTTTVWDFKKDIASTNTSEIDSYKVPVVLVIKKNHRTLANLLEWLKDNSAKGDQEMIDQPMLLIDDEADNASINTKYANSASVKKLVTTINGQIRDLLNMFHRSCYIGYTATPFANIFIDPEQDHEMYSEDLFPRDFIIGLDAASNYFGPKKIFIDGLYDDGTSIWLRYIEDNEDILPIKHKKDHDLDVLPDSLYEALRVFLLSRTIRNIRGQKKSHCSMLVNASRFTDVQGILRNRLHAALEKIKNAVRINASLGTLALNDPEIRALYHVWKREYSHLECGWPLIQDNLLDAIASAKAVEVNSRANDLDYTNSVERGQTVIVVGGFSLSRGLTLEGLTVTWFLRNTMMYDTLMQMGRWFGYRGGYEDLCRIWMPRQAIEWYAFIANATEELHDELLIMEKAKATPSMFGLAVRSSPASLLVTARNKMGSGKKVTTRVGLANSFIETSRVSTKPIDLDANREVARDFIKKIERAGIEKEIVNWGTLIRGVPIEFIDEFLAAWRNTEQSVTTDTGPVRDYLKSKKDYELNSWDVLIPTLKSGQESTILGKPIIPARRAIDAQDLKSGFMSFGGKKMRIASRGIEKAGLPFEIAEIAEQEYRKEKKYTDDEQVNYPDSIYRRRRKRGLFILYLLKAISPKGAKASKEDQLIPNTPVVAWGMSLPASTSRADERVEYVVNTIKYQELFGEEDEDDDQQSSLEGE